MKIYIDADACPRAIKDILYKAAIRVNCPLVLVANLLLSTPRHPLISTVRVDKGFDMADNHIVKAVISGDLVVTADIPLASEVIAKNATALNPRGELYTKANIQQRLTMRDFMDTLRSSGIETGGPSTLSQRDIQNFANALDKYLTSAQQNHKK